jgi:hypothetical protein
LLCVAFDVQGLPGENGRRTDPNFYALGKCPTCQREVIFVGGRRPPIPIACCSGHHNPQAVYRARRVAKCAERRLEHRTDRTCDHCGKVFTPKNSLGKTCSLRCRVALYRQGERKPASEPKEKASEPDTTVYIPRGQTWEGRHRITAEQTDQEKVATFRKLCEPMMAEAKELTDRNTNTIAPLSILHKVVLLQRWAKELGRVAKEAGQTGRQPIVCFCKAFAPVVREARQMAMKNTNTIEPQELLKRLVTMEGLMKELYDEVG